MVYARCPQCSTLFRVTGMQLRAAHGYVRCGGCRNIFNALQTLSDSPEDAPATRGKKGSQAPSGHASSHGKKIPIPSQGVLDLEPGDLDPSDATRAVEPDAQPLPFDVPEDLPDLAPTDPADTAPATGNGRRLGSSVGWALGILVLSLLPFLQLSWFERGKLMETTEGRAILEALCGIAGCEPPYPRNPEEFRILQREISAPPELPGTLKFRLTFVNDGENPQPYPGIMLSLYTGEDVLAAQRTFVPAEYLGGQGNGTLMPTATPVSVGLDLADPGQRLTGFRLEFK